MASFTSGYYVPSSMSQSYVLSKRDDEGTLKYQGAIGELGIQQQEALQNLQTNYESTINNAYASYLANQRTINTSAMGQGYKELYEQAQEQQLLSDIATANMNLANTRSEIAENVATAQANVLSQAQLETSNLNRVQGALTQYLQYIKSLRDEAGGLLLSEEDQGKTIDDLYDTLLNYSSSTLQNYSDGANTGLGFADWIRTQLSGSEEDTAWGDWLFGGGLADFRNMVAKTNAANKKPDEEKKPYNPNATNTNNSGNSNNNNNTNTNTNTNKPSRWGNSMLI